MARPLELEAFDMPNPASQLPEALQAEVEEVRLTAYEKGYSAGWDDAISAQNADVARLRSDLGHNLMEMSLSYRDARRHVLGTLEPLLNDMVGKVLPAIAHQTLGHIILEQLRPVAETLASAPITVKTAPATHEMVEKLLTGEAGLPVRVIAEPTLSDGQAYLKLAESEVLVDLDGVIAAISSAVTDYFRIENDEEN